MPQQSKPQAVWMRLHKEGRKRFGRLLIVQGVTHRELAQAVGWRSHGMISQLLSGHRAGVEPDKALGIAKYLGVDVSDLFLTEMSSNTRQAGKGRRVA